ncbi:hypothetical protein L1887_63199 [Cichorium endivia]|nr:hypothetical protein L1887_63199 [Cichorium endivia]
MLARVDSCIGHAPRLAVWQCRYHIPQSGKPTRSEPGGKIRCKGGVDCKPMLPPKGELSSADLGIPLSATPATDFKSAPKIALSFHCCCLPLLHPCRRIPWLPRILLLVIISALVCPFSNSFIPVIVSRTRRCRLARSARHHPRALGAALSTALGCYNSAAKPLARSLHRSRASPSSCPAPLPPRLRHRFHALLGDTLGKVT